MISAIDVDIVLNSNCGIAALEVTYYALSQGIDVALANKGIYRSRRRTCNINCTKTGPGYCP